MTYRFDFIHSFRDLSQTGVVTKKFDIVRRSQLSGQPIFRQVQRFFQINILSMQVIQILLSPAMRKMCCTTITMICYVQQMHTNREEEYYMKRLALISAVRIVTAI